MILIDYRIGSGDLARYFTDPRVPWEIATPPGLPYGDFQFVGNGPAGPVLIGIERKALKDALNSIHDGRLTSHQLPGMMDLAEGIYDVSYLIIEGLYRIDDQGILQEPHRFQGQMIWEDVVTGTNRWDFATFSGWLNSIEMQTGVRIRETRNKEHTAALITSLWRSWNKPWDDHRSLKVFQDMQTGVGFEKPNLVRRWAKELTGIGWDRSKAVAEVFNTGFDMVVADPAKWQQIRGVKTLGIRAWKEIRGIK